MKATAVRQMLGVQDKEIILHGFLIDSHSVDIWFENGRVVRRVFTGARIGRKEVEIDRIEQEDFQLDILTVNLRDASRKLTNAQMVDLARTFGRPIPLT